MPIKINESDLTPEEIAAVEFAIKQSALPDDKPETVQEYLDRLLPGQSAINDYVHQMKQADSDTYSPLFGKALQLSRASRVEAALFIIAKCQAEGVDLSDLDPALLAFMSNVGSIGEGK